MLSSKKPQTSSGNSNNNVQAKNIKVILRIRPLLSGEHYGSSRIGFTDRIIQLSKEKQFALDAVLPPSTSQSELYAAHVHDALNECLDIGFNYTVFAYGQTGSGKTFTMFGAEVSSRQVISETTNAFRLHENSGLIQRILYQIFSHEKVEELSISFLEIYCETIVDLLADCVDETSAPEIDKESMNIRVNASGDIVIAGLSKLSASSIEEAETILNLGFQRRATSTTAAHRHSSRSHAVLQLHILTDGKPIVVSVVDLAGSERLKKTQHSLHGSGFQEAIKINSGLLALANVIRSLTQSTSFTSVSSPTAHVPYRQSKLTRLLKDSLGGSSVTLMIACISPHHADHAESVNTASYAARARNIKNRVLVQRSKLNILEDDDAETLCNESKDIEDEEELDQEDDKNESSNPIETEAETRRKHDVGETDSDSIKELVSASMTITETEWIERYMPALRSKTVQVANLSSQLAKSNEYTTELEQKLNDAAEYIQKLGLTLQEKIKEIEELKVSNTINNDESLSRSSSSSFTEFIQVKKALKQSQQELATARSMNIDLDAQLQEVLERYQSELEKSGSKNKELREKCESLEKDNYYYRVTNRNLKDKLKQMIAIHEQRNTPSA